MVFTSVTASAPSSRATRAIATISGSTGDSLTDIGLVPAARQRRTSSRSPSGVAPNSRPPAVGLGPGPLTPDPRNPGGSGDPADPLDITGAGAARHVHEHPRALEPCREPWQLVLARGDEPRIREPDRVQHTAGELRHPGGGM